MISIQGVVPSCDNLFNIIFVKYFLVFEFGVFCSFKKKIELPITIGTIPFKVDGAQPICSPDYRNCIQFYRTKTEKTEGVT